MRNECDKLQDAISFDRPFLTQRFDALAEERINNVIADLERRAALEETRSASCAGAPAVIDKRYPHQIEGRPGGLVDLRESPRRRRSDLIDESSRLIAPQGAHVVHTKTLLAVSEFAPR